jgi:hypothetical protein
MSKVSLKVVVAGRTYPLTVQESEVEKVQRAAEDARLIGDDRLAIVYKGK